jgi:DNA uptake protein ComE-like DNA-binding protein
VSLRTTYDGDRVARNGLTALLIAVSVGSIATSASDPAAVGSRVPGNGGSHSVVSSWAPNLARVDRSSAEHHAVLALLRGERLEAASASLSDLQLIDGIGPARARQILAARRAGSLESLDDVDRLPGFGPSLIARLAPALEFVGPKVAR